MPDPEVIRKSCADKARWRKPASDVGLRGRRNGFWDEQCGRSDPKSILPALREPPPEDRLAVRPGRLQARPLGNPSGIDPENSRSPARAETYRHERASQDPRLEARLLTGTSTDR